MDQVNRFRTDGNGRLGHDARTPTASVEGPGIGELFKRVSADVSLLARQEMQLAKAELRESVDEVKGASAKFAIAAVIALPGAMALTAFLVIVLAGVLGSWWAASLIVGVALIVVAGLLVRQGKAALSSGNVGMPETAASLAEDAEWGKQEVKAFKRELTA